MSEIKYDIIVFGATSFVGNILTRYLVEQYGTGQAVSWAIAGRSQDKLDALCASLGDGGTDIPVVIANASSEADMKQLCHQAKVIISTVGPYALYGEPLVKACAETGTGYVDLTGEAHWVRKMMDRYGSKAEETGARIVPSCGFDSIPSDLGVYFLQEEAKKRLGSTCPEVSMRVKAAKGGISGGTAASMLNLVREASKDKELRKELADPYSLCPEGTPHNPSQKSVSSAKKDPVANTWIAPFVMAAINERVVLRSNALLGYDEDFTYNEAIMTGPGSKGAIAAGSITAGIGAFMLGVAVPPTRWAIEKFMLPAPGEGPTPEAQLNGYFDLRFFGTTSDGQLISAKVTGDRDPGYGATAKMLAESGICLAQDITQEAVPGGFWTTAAAFGDTLVKRLEDNAGLAFTVID